MSVIWGNPIASITRKPAAPLVFYRSQCSWCSPESIPGACDGGHPCQNFATVHDLEDDQDYCRYHFWHRDGVR